MSETDIRETYEMLRAAHTLNRMAFGAVAMFGDFDEEKAKQVSNAFNTVFKSIFDVANSIYAGFEPAKAVRSHSS